MTIGRCKLDRLTRRKKSTVLNRPPRKNYLTDLDKICMVVLHDSTATNRYVPRDDPTTTAHAGRSVMERASFRLATFVQRDPLTARPIRIRKTHKVDPFYDVYIIDRELTACSP